MPKFLRLCRLGGLTFVILLFASSGALHFLATDLFVSIIPPHLPWRYAAVYLSGACELSGALGLCLPRCRRAAGIGLFLLTIAVTPANIYMWLRADLFPQVSPALLFWRLPAQLALLAMIWRVAIQRAEPELG